MSGEVIGKIYYDREAASRRMSTNGDSKGAGIDFPKDLDIRVKSMLIAVNFIIVNHQ